MTLSKRNVKIINRVIGNNIGENMEKYFGVYENIVLPILNYVIHV